MINPWYFVKNLLQSWRVCPTWPDRWTRMRWLYSDRGPGAARSNRRRIRFHYDSPIGDLSVFVRDNGGADAFIMSEVFDHRYYEFDLPSSPRTILDLGANAGFTALFFARAYPQAEIACVEPMTDNVELLQQNLALNNVKAAVFPAAISIEDGSLEMASDSNDYGHKVAHIAYGPSVEGPISRVEAICVPSVLKKLKWSRIGLLKVDIEGYEGVLLKERCDWLHQVDAICIECHEGYGLSDLTALGRSYGFLPAQKLPGTWLLYRERMAA